MKKKTTIIQRFILLLILGIVIYSCSGITRATDLFEKPSARELYLRNFDSPELVQIWEEQADLAFKDSVLVLPPYSEAGKFFPGSFPVYSYEVALNPGEKVRVEVDKNPETLVFIDLFKKKGDTLITYEPISSAAYGSNFLEEEISSPGIYKIVVQPEVKAASPFSLRIETSPVYEFPVASYGNRAIQSFWGAERDGGRRSHEGIDIFASRGTPVVAATRGRVTRTGNKGLGGKQVWLRDNKRGLSLYYAHLDSIIATPGMTVSPGDTLGLVGNTGNARTTPPHLHFGIYGSFSGAVNPFSYVFQPEKSTPAKMNLEELEDYLFISSGTANLRSGPSTEFPVLTQIQSRDTLKVLGKTGGWYHIRSRGRASFIHEGLVKPL